MENSTNHIFENTTINFRDCLKALERITNEGEPVSKREWQCAHAMYIYAREFVEIYQEWEKSNAKINIEE